jgi:prolyl-tRNA synthetase
MDNEVVQIALRHEKTPKGPTPKVELKWSEVVDKIPGILDQVHNDMLAKAKEERNKCIVKVTKWEEVMPALAKKCMILAPWCETIESEEEIKKLTKEASEEEMKKVFFLSKNLDLSMDARHRFTAVDDRKVVLLEGWRTRAFYISS